MIRGEYQYDPATTDPHFALRFLDGEDKQLREEYSALERRHKYELEDIQRRFQQNRYERFKAMEQIARERQ